MTSTFETHTEEIIINEPSKRIVTCDSSGKLLYFKEYLDKFKTLDDLRKPDKKVTLPLEEAEKILNEIRDIYSTLPVEPKYHDRDKYGQDKLPYTLKGIYLNTQEHLANVISKLSLFILEASSEK